MVKVFESNKTETKHKVTNLTKIKHIYHIIKC